MGTFIQLVVDGLSTGSIYAALALAIVLVNQATGLINFAQGGLAVLSSYIAYAFVLRGRVPQAETLAGVALLIAGVVWAVRTQPAESSADAHPN